MAGKRHFDTPFNLYHLSEENHDGQLFEPRPMDKMRVMEGENWKTPRICVSNSIDGAVSALVDSMSYSTGLKLWVHVPQNLLELFASNKVYKPSLRQVPDSETTGEHWLKAPALMKAIGQIEVIGVDCSANLYYMWKGDKTRMDRFNWKWTVSFFVIKQE